MRSKFALTMVWSQDAHGFKITNVSGGDDELESLPVRPNFFSGPRLWHEASIPGETTQLVVVILHAQLGLTPSPLGPTGLAFKKSR